MFTIRSVATQCLRHPRNLEEDSDGHESNRPVNPNKALREAPTCWASTSRPTWSTPATGACRTGVESNVIERFAAASIPADRISFARDTYVFDTPRLPAEFVADFRHYYGPTMNAFAAATEDGKAEELQRELVSLFERENRSPVAGRTTIPATFLKVIVACP